MVRQLTAIMFTDMVGYTALMQKDEGQAKEYRDRHRTVLEAAITDHGGRILQFVGDGTLSVFRSAIAAVEAAIEIQTALQAEAPPIPLRIGIHTGDVVHDDDGVFGDGVNVASRVEGLGVAGAVLISDKVLDEVKNQPTIQTTSLGSFNLKNVQRPMEVYAVTNPGLAVPTEAEVMPQRGTCRSIAVLPFVNMSSDPENEFFSDGVTEQIINGLTRVNGLQVTARTSSFALKDHTRDIREIAAQLGVTHVLEGSVRRAGDRVRVTAQLICAADGYHLFSEAYDRRLEDIFGVQDEIARTIVEALADHLEPVNTSGAPDGRLIHEHSTDSEAYIEYLRGRFEWAAWSPRGVRRAMERFQRSAEMDPRCGLPRAGASTAYVFLGLRGHLSTEKAFRRAQEEAERALELEEDSGEAHTAMGAVRLFHHWDWKGAYRSFQKALSLNPGSAEAHRLYAMYLGALGETEEAVEEFRTAVALDPLSHHQRSTLAEGLLLAGRLDEAEEALAAILEDDPEFRPAIETMGWTAVARGNLEAAAGLFESLPASSRHTFAAGAARGYVYARQGRLDEARAMQALLREGNGQDLDATPFLDLALIHQGLGEIDEAFQHLNGAVDRGIGAVVFLAENPVWHEELRGDPRFDALLARINHPRAVSA